MGGGWRKKNLVRVTNLQEKKLNKSHAASNNGNKLIDQKRSCIVGGVNYRYDDDEVGGGGGGNGSIDSSGGSGDGGGETGGNQTFFFSENNDQLVMT